MPIDQKFVVYGDDDEVLSLEDAFERLVDLYVKIHGRCESIIVNIYYSEHSDAFIVCDADKKNQCKARFDRDDRPVLFEGIVDGNLRWMHSEEF